MGAIADALGGSKAGLFGGDLFPKAASTAPAPLPLPQPATAHGIGGFFHNLGSDVVGLGQGIGQLGGLALGDLVHAATLGKVGSSFRLDDVVKQLPSGLAHDYASRYGSPGKFVHGLYEHPGSFLLDLFTAGDIAAKGAGLAAKVPEVAAGLDALKAGAAAESVGAGTRLVSTILPETRPVLKGLQAPLTGIEQVTEAANPIRRLLLDKPLARLTTEPLAALEERARTLQEAADAGHLMPGDVTEARQMADLAAKVKAAGIERIPTQRISDYRLKQAMGRLVADNTTEWMGNRATDTAAWHEVLKPVIAEGLDSQAFGRFQGLDVEIPELAGKKVALPGAEGLTPREAPLTIPAPSGGARVATRPVVAAPDVIDTAHEAARTLVADQWHRPMIDQGLLTPEIIRDRAYLPLRMKYGMKWDPAALDPVTGLKGAFTGGPSVEDLQTALKAAGIPEPIYFPHLDTRRLKFSDFLRSMNPVGGRKRAVSPGYAKRDTGWLLRSGNALIDPLEAYSRRAAQGVGNAETIKLFERWLKGDPEKNIMGFGRRVKGTEQIGSHEALVAPDGFHRFFRAKAAVEDGVVAGLADGMTPDEALAGALKAAIVPIQDEIAAGGRDIIGVARGELWAVPKASLEQFQKYVKPVFSATTEKRLRLFWDTPMNAWRGAVLAGSPRWLMNNLLGNVTFLKMQGGKTADAVRIMEERFREALSKGGYESDFLKKLEAVPGVEKARGGMFTAEASYNPRLGMAGESKLGQGVEAVRSSPIGRGARAYGSWMRRVNGQIEDAFREASYLKGAERQQIAAGVRKAGRSFFSSKGRLERIAEGGLTDAQAKSALSEVNYFLNDYTKLGPFERKIVRRFAFPFYSFYKHIARLSLSYPVDFPLRAEVLSKLGDVSKDMLSEETGPIPAWLSGAIPIGKNPDGSIKFLNTRGPNPFSGLGQDFTSSLSPPIKVALEQALGRDLFTGREFTDPSVITPFGGSQKYRVGPGGATPVDKVAPGLLENLLRNFPQYQLAESVAAGGATYDTSNLASILQNRIAPVAGQAGPIMRTPTGETKYPTDTIQQILRLLGASTTDYNLTDYQRRQAEDQAQVLKAYLQRIGLAPPSTP